MIPWFVRQCWRDRALVGTLAVAVIFIAWTALSSVALTRMLAVRDYYPFSEPDSYWQWWSYLLDADQPLSIDKWLLASGIIGTLPWAALLLRELQDLKGRRLVRRPGGSLQPLQAGVTDNHGHAAWATPEQICRRFAGPGCLIGAMGRQATAKCLFDDVNRGPGHSMVFAGPGSHKSMSVVTRLWTWRGPRVVFDPSCEIGPLMSRALREKGFNVITIGLDGQGLNALEWIDIRHREADAHIRSAVDWIYNEDATGRAGGNQSRDPFWSTWGRSLVTCLAAYLLYDLQSEKTLATLRAGIATPEADMPVLLAGIHQISTSRMARDLAGGLMNMRAEETFSGIYANAFAATEWLSTGAYADVVSGSAMRTSDILRPDTIVFVQIPLRTLLVTPAVGRATMGALFNAMFHADGDVGRRILFEIDEAWVLGRLREIMLVHTTARKYRGAVNTIWQSEKQLEEVWGREGAGALRDMLSWRSYNGIQDGRVAEQLSMDIGEHAVLAYSEGLNAGRSKPFGFSMPSTNRGSNVNTHEIKRRLIKADEILRAPADEMFVLARDFPRPIRCFTAPYFRYPAIANRMSTSRFVA
jgi:type IV secretion system protein VirD4